MHRSVLIIQARMGSSRLPGKSMLPLAGKPMIQRILERVSRCKTIDEIVLAIPDTRDNEILGTIAHNLNVSIFAGSEHDVLDRYYRAAKTFNADTVIRLPADNPVPEPREIDRIVEYHLSQGICAFSSNLSVIDDNGYPDGIGAEVFDISLLEYAWKNNYAQRFREHVHLNFFDYELMGREAGIGCKVQTLLCPQEFRRPDLVLDVNTRSQYEFLSSIYDYLYPKNNEFHITEIIDWFDHIYCVHGSMSGGSK